MKHISLQLPEFMPDGSPWPKISIITPSYNQGRFIEETIRSVLLQGYPNLEYIIIDGGSKDNSVEIIRRYEKYLAYWVSEKDHGQSHAINKGVIRATGDIMAWINSDDLYYTYTFQKIAKAMWRRGKITHPVVFGDVYQIDEKGNKCEKWLGKPGTRDDIIAFWEGRCHFPQASVFMKGSILKANLLDESLHYVMDWELYLRLSKKYNFHYIPEPLAKFRIYKGSKTSGGWTFFEAEQLVVSKHYWGPGLLRYLRFYISYALSPFTKFFRNLPKTSRRFLRRFLGNTMYEKLRSYIKN